MKKRTLFISSVLFISSLSILAIVALAKFNEAIEMDEQEYIKD